MKRQGMSLLLMLALVVGLLPVSVFAQDFPADGEESSVEEETEICEHEDTEVLCSPVGDWIHAVTEQCICGEETDWYEEDCSDEDDDGFCDSCEAGLPCLHEDTAITYQPGRKEETHIAITLCICGEEVDSVMQSCRDEDGDGLCDGCEAQLVEPITLGDVNEDGTITKEDAKYILRYVVQTVDTIDEDVADVDGDGMITAMDATFILRYCADLIDVFPVEV